MNLATAERAKYEALWAQHPAYRGTAPGELRAGFIIEALGAKPGESVIDYGCGTGRGAMVWRHHGFDVLGVDIAPNCLDDGVDIPLVVAPLWDLPPELPPSDWCYCVDVLEHLPPEKVDESLAAIADHTRAGGFLQPALQPARWDERVGETLHLTVRPAEWWLETIGRYFSKVTLLRMKPHGHGHDALPLVVQV